MRRQRCGDDYQQRDERQAHIHLGGRNHTRGDTQHHHAQEHRFTGTVQLGVHIGHAQDAHDAQSHDTAGHKQHDIEDDFASGHALE
jgi:hypothetical protein